MIATILRYVITATILCLAGWAGWSIYRRYQQDPWTRDGQVRANVVGIAPRVSGPIVRVAVRDNQEVKRGDPLFEIDDSDYKARLDVADGQVATAEASLKTRQQDLERQEDLYKKHVNSLQDFENAQNNFAGAQAEVVSAKANQELARLNLGYTKVVAPVDGYVTNVNISDGTYVNAGTQLMALVDTNSFWIAAYFKETQLGRISVGQKANISVLGYGRQPFTGIVRSVGWGIYVPDGSAGGSGELLPSVSQTIDWVRLPQRFPVRIQAVGKPPVALRIGQTVSVSMTSQFEQAPLEQKTAAQPSN
jgi:multidrug resistance efflux pump